MNWDPGGAAIPLTLLPSVNWDPGVMSFGFLSLELRFEGDLPPRLQVGKPGAAVRDAQNHQPEMVLPANWHRAMPSYSRTLEQNQPRACPVDHQFLAGVCLGLSL